MLDQTHINWYDWLEPDRDTLPPVSFVNPHQPVLMGIPVPELHIPYAFSTRVTVENSIGAWPGRSKGNCKSSMKCPDPTLLTMDPYGAKTRWIDVSAGGPRNVEFKVEVDQPWLKVSQHSGKIKRDASSDHRLYVSIDWEKVARETKEDEGHVTIRSSDAANVTVTVPIMVPDRIDDAFEGYIQGDGYVVIEAGHYSSKNGKDGYAWEEMEGYGRTLSGMEVFPISSQNFSVGTGPSLNYKLWAHQTGNAVLIVQTGPSLNFLPGTQISFGVQIDDSPAKEIQPVSTERLGGVEVVPGQKIFVGAVPPDWQEVVKSDMRNVTVPISFDRAGEHEITLWGMSAGVVIERIWVDFGGITERGYSYLGPPESVYRGGSH